jgi:hypothetical protein
MTAKVGDLLVLSGHKAGEHERRAEIVRVLGVGGAAPDRVRWPDGHESTISPASDTGMEPPALTERSSQRGGERRLEPSCRGDGGHRRVGSVDKIHGRTRVAPKRDRAPPGDAALARGLLPGPGPHERPPPSVLGGIS